MEQMDFPTENHKGFDEVIVNPKKKSLGLFSLSAVLKGMLSAGTDRTQRHVYLH